MCVNDVALIVTLVYLNVAHPAFADSQRFHTPLFTDSVLQCFEPRAIYVTKPPIGCIVDVNLEEIHMKRPTNFAQDQISPSTDLVFRFSQTNSSNSLQVISEWYLDLDRVQYAVKFLP